MAFLFGLINPPTQRQPLPVPDPDDVNRQLSARLVQVEANQIDLRARVDDLFLQVMTARQQENEFSRDLAATTQERLLHNIEDLEKQRKELNMKKIKAATATEVLVLDMMDDTLQQRLERTRAELERAGKVVDSKNKAIDRDSEKIEAIKLGKPEPVPEKQIGKPAWWNARFDRVMDAFILVLAWAVLQEWILPLLNVAFAKKP